MLFRSHAAGFGAAEAAVAARLYKQVSRARGREIELAVETFAEHLAEFLRFLVIVDADSEDLDFIFLRFG